MFACLHSEACSHPWVDVPQNGSMFAFRNISTFHEAPAAHHEFVARRAARIREYWSFANTCHLALTALCAVNATWRTSNLRRGFGASAPKPRRSKTYKITQITKVTQITKYELWKLYILQNKRLSYVFEIFQFFQ